MPGLIQKAIGAVGAPFKAIGDKALDLVSSHVSYSAPTPPPQMVAPKVALPPVIGSLPSGTKVAPLPPQWVEPVKQAYQQYPDIPKGIVEAILHQESSMGSNDTNYNPQIGESAWLAGLTTGAKEEIVRRLGQTPDLDSQAGTIQAIAAYLSLIRNRHDESGKVVRTVDDPFELYNDYYKTDSGHKLSKKQMKDFKDLVSYYANNPLAAK